MRIIGGEFRRRRLHTPKDETVTRPMPDIVREALFNLLRGHTEGVAVFDAFAGTGAIGLEAVSRGASYCVFVERDRAIAKILQHNIDDLGAADRCEVFIGDALGPGALSRCPHPTHLVFYDPPYALVRDPAGWRRCVAQLSRLIERLDEDGYAVLRTPWPFLQTPDEPRSEPPPRRRRADRRPPHTRADDELQEPAPADRPKPITPDLSIPGADGPETHAYGGTALHLYMRRARD